MDLSADTRREMFWNMLLARRLDERAWMLHRQGKIAFHISGIGHETAQVGAAYALRRGYDWIVPYYRDLALMLCLGYTPRDFILALMGKREDRTSGGRQMPSHWSLKEMNVLSHSSPVGTQATQAVGVGLGIKLNKEDRVVLTTIGEGATAQGEWYEAVNWAAIQKLPVVFNVQNNQYAISEGVEKQMAVKSVAEKACGLGLNGVCVDGDDLFAVYAAFQKAFADARAGLGPTLVETLVYRITPHSSDDDDRSYRTREEVEAHRKNDGLLRTRNLLERDGVLTPHSLDEMEARIKPMLDDAVAYAEAAAYPAPDDEFRAVYADAEQPPHA